MNTEIIPAIMPHDFDDVTSYVGLVHKYTSMVQLDIMDGKYVPESTWPFFRNSHNYLNQIKNQDKVLPFWEDVNYELDLMVTRPEEDLETWLNIGAARFIFHYGSVFNWQKIRDIKENIENFIEIGLAIHIDDTIEDIYSLIDEGVFDYIQIMGIAHIGYQGEAFDVRCFDIIKKIKIRYPEIPLGIDGGVSLRTISSLFNQGVVCFVSGSAIFAHGDIKENIELLKKQISHSNYE